MSEHRRRTRRTWEGENTAQPESHPAPAVDNDLPEPEPALVYDEDPVNWGEPSAHAAPVLPPRRPPRKPRSTENLLLAAISLVALLVALVFGVLIYLRTRPAENGANAVPTAVPYDVTQPFTLEDLTPAQRTRIEEGGGAFALYDYEIGPHGLRIGDSLDTLLERFPVTYTQSEIGDYVWDEADENMRARAQHLLETDYQVIYAARVFYQGGEQVALPPCGTMSIGSDAIVVMLTAPCTPYPEGTGANYLAYPHVYCKVTIDPDTSRITRIVLGQNL